MMEKIPVSEAVIRAIARRYPNALGRGEIEIENGAIKRWDIEAPIPKDDDQDVKIATDAYVA